MSGWWTEPASRTPFSRSAGGRGRALALTFAGLVHLGQARGEPTEDVKEVARRHFRRGIDLSKSADYRPALAEFRRANAIAPSHRIDFNIGQTCLELREYACALEAFERCLTAGDSELPKARRASVKAEIARLQQLVGVLEIVVNKPGAEVLVDDASVGSTPLAPVRVDPGTHRVVIQLAPWSPLIRSIEIAGGERVALDFAFVDPEEPPAPPTPAVPIPELASPPPRPTAPAHTAHVATPSRGPIWIGLAVTVGLAGSAAVMGGLSLAAKGDLDDAVARIDASRSEIDDARSTLDDRSIATDVLLGTTLVAATVTAVLAIVGERRASATRVGHAATLVPAFTPAIGRGPAR